MKLIVLPLFAAALIACAAPVQAACGSRLSVEEVLERVNAVRAAGYRCGGRSMTPAGALKWNAALHSAAAGHSRDMARRNYFEHSSPEGVNVSGRASSAHYKFRFVGENIAAGLSSVPEAVQAWLDSPDHCENMMDPQFRDVAVACVESPGSDYGTYWTMMLGRQ